MVKQSPICGAVKQQKQHILTLVTAVTTAPKRSDHLLLTIFISNSPFLLAGQVEPDAKAKIFVTQQKLYLYSIVTVQPSLAQAHPLLGGCIHSSKST